MVVSEMQGSLQKNVIPDNSVKAVFTLEILKIIKDAQQQHGLRHGDFQRYRSYCTRRIRRLRKALHLPQGDKRHFKRKDVTETILKDERYLYIPLMLAERAWSYAIQLRQESNTEPRKKFHLVSRLRKAVTYANQLQTLCQSDICDARSKLEAQAYVAWIAGTMQFELHLWKDALENFQQAQVVYQNLCEAVEENDQPVYKHKCEELLPSLRYCSYNVGDSSAITDLQEMRNFADQDMLEKLDALMTEARSKTGDKIVKSITWLDKNVTVPSKPVAAVSFLLAEQEMADELLDIDMLERHLLRCKDAMAAVRDEIASEQSGKTKVGNISQLQQLLTYLTYVRLKRSNQRTFTMINNAKKDDKKAKSQDLIRLYELVIQNLSEMQQLAGTEDNDEYQLNLEATINAYKSMRCYYIAEVMSSMKRYREAQAMYDRSGFYAAKVTASGGKLEQEDLSQTLKSLLSKVESAKVICMAHAVLQQQQDNVEQIPKTGTIIDKKNISKIPLADRLDEYNEDVSLVSKRPNIIKLPPDMKATPGKPLFYDVALNYLEFPRLDDKKAPGANQQAGITGFVSKLWGGWGNK